MKNRISLVLLILGLLLSSCGGGGSGGVASNNSANQNTSTWSQVGAANNNVFVSIAYDANTKNVYGLRTDRTICYISANASSSDKWSCDIILPADIKSSSVLTGGENGNLYLIGYDYSYKSYVLKYNTTNNLWDKLIIASNTVPYLDYITYYNGALWGYYGRGLLSLNVSTGQLSSIDNYFPQDISSSISIDSSGNTYYVSATQSIEYKNIFNLDQQEQMGETLKDILPAGFTVAHSALYVCNQYNKVSYLSLGASSTTSWNQLLFPTNYMCEFLISGDDELFSYSMPIYYSGDKSMFKLFKYKTN